MVIGRGTKKQTANVQFTVWHKIIEFTDYFFRIVKVRSRKTFVFLQKMCSPPLTHPAGEESTLSVIVIVVSVSITTVDSLKS